jgi:hypothetical protein
MARKSAVAWVAPKPKALEADTVTVTGACSVTLS